MSFETPKTPQVIQRENFLNKVKSEVARLVNEGRLSEEQAEEKMTSAKLVETGLSGDPEHDARQFAGAGVYTEQEMIDIFNEEK